MFVLSEILAGIFSADGEGGPRTTSVAKARAYNLLDLRSYALPWLPSLVTQGPAAKIALMEPSMNDQRAAEGLVTVRGAGDGFAQEIVSGDHRLRSDEPASAGGTDTGPTPYDLLLAALGSCTSMTVGMYARRKQWPLERITVRLRHSRVHAEDCAACETQDAMLTVIDRDIELDGSLSEDQRRRLLAIADRCPVHMTLTSRIDIRTTLH